MTTTTTTRALARRQHRRRRRGRGRAVDVLRGLAAVLAILTVVVGAPALLSVVAPIGLPSAVPTWDQVTAVLMRPDDGTLFLALLTLAAWGGWAVFTISVLLEAIAQARALPTPRLPGAGWSQRLAASLVTTAGLLLTSTAPLLAAAPVAHATVATAPEATTPAMAAGPVATSATVPAPAVAAVSPAATADVDRHPVVVVERGDSLWRLAERHLGDGERFPEIVALNHGHPQPDGRALNDTNWIHPGWSLRLPTDATDVPTPATAAPSAAMADGERATTSVVVHEVERGDTLWGISAEHLGDGARYREIYDLNAGVPQEDGRTLTDPDLIRPGWDLTFPTSTVPDVEAVGEPQAAGPDGAAAGTPEDAPPAEGPQVVEEAAPLTGDPAPDGVTEGEDVESRTDADEAEPGADLEAVEAAPVAQSFFAGLTAIGAATVIGMLARLRARQQKDRRPGERILMPEPGTPAAATERALRRAGPALSVEDLTLALTALVPAARAAGRDLPTAALVRVSDERLELHLAEPDADALAPFTSTGPRVWAAPLTALTGLEDDPSSYWPYPALVSVGVDADGAVVLVNLEAAGTLVITGQPETAAAVLRAMACELATSRPLHSTCVWVAPALAGLREASHVGTTQSGGLDALARGAARVLEQCRRDGIPNVLNARSQVTDGEPCYPDVWVVTDPAPALPPWSGYVILTTGQPAPDGAWVLDVQPDGAAILEPAGLPLHAPRLSEAGYRDIVDLLVQGFADNALPEPGAPSAPPSPPVRAVTSLAEDTVEALAALPHPPSPTPPAEDGPEPENGDTSAAEPAADDAGGSGAGGEAPPRVLLLGPVQVTTGHDAGGDGRSRRTLELLAYLALHPGGVSAAELDEIIGHGNRVPPTTRNTAISRARARLGKDDGQPYLLPFQPGTGYRLAPAVRTDWDDFLHHARHGLAAGPNGVDHLTTALNLVRGRPFTGAAPGTYDWAEAITQEMISTITDIAHAAARTHLHAGNPADAAAAAAVGLTVDPCNEQLYRDAIAAAGARGNTEEIHRLANNLCAHLTQIDPLERADEETYDLVHSFVTTGNDVVGYRRREPTRSTAT